jgi:hypothetical protein
MNTIKPITPEVDKLISDLAAELKPAVAAIEAQIPTTRGNYGSYLGILGNCTSKQSAQIVVLALIAAGANRQGVGDAFRLQFGQ